jgi:flagellar biosynthetic protein FliR
VHFTSAEIAGWIGTFLWPFFRIGAMTTVAPVFGTRAVPVRIRLGIALALTLVIAPVLPPAPAVDPLTAQGVIITLQQLLIGLSLAFVLRLVFTVMELAGEAVSNLMGLGFAAMVDPLNGNQSVLLGQFYLILATLVFLSLNGHLLWIEALAESFRLLPVGEAGLTREGAWWLATFGSNLFSWAVRMALPLLAALLVVNLAFGVLTRAAPQLNVFSVGFPLVLALGFVLLMVTLPVVLNKLWPLTLEGLDRAALVLKGAR